MTKKIEEHAYFHIGNSGVNQIVTSAEQATDKKQYYLEASLNSHGVEGPNVVIPLIHREQIHVMIKQLQQVLNNDDMMESWDQDYASGIYVYARNGVETSYTIKNAEDYNLPNGEQ
jgi:hypothetical protein